MSDNYPVMSFNQLFAVNLNLLQQMKHEKQTKLQITMLVCIPSGTSCMHFCFLLYQLRKTSFVFFHCFFIILSFRLKNHLFIKVCHLHMEQSYWDVNLWVVSFFICLKNSTDFSFNTIKELSRNPPDGVSVGLGDDENIFNWELMIIGPPDTLYEGGFFKAKLDFPADFPNAPPVMTFKTSIWHPNGFKFLLDLYSCSYCCFSVRQWDSVYINPSSSWWRQIQWKGNCAILFPTVVLPTWCRFTGDCSGALETNFRCRVHHSVGNIHVVGSQRWVTCQYRCCSKLDKSIVLPLPYYIF